MKTIEELRKEAEIDFVAKTKSGVNPLAECISRLSFISGWDAAVNELLRWHDLKKELPETDVEVLVMVHTDGHTYDVMRYDMHGWWQKIPGGWDTAEHTPIGWRYIHEI